MRSQGEMVAAVCDGVARFQSEYVGRGPKDINGHLFGTLLVVRLQDALSLAERRLIQDAGNGTATDGGPALSRALLKRMRAHMVAVGRPHLAGLVEAVTGVRVVSVHHDISTVTGEEVLVFSLTATPACRTRGGVP